MAQKPRIKGIPRVTAYAALVSFGNTAIAAITGNLTFPAPFPTLIDIQSAVTLVENDIAAWGPQGARGSHQDLMTLRSDALALRNLLVQLEGYILNTVVAGGGDYAFQSSELTSSGFGVKNPPTPQGLLGVPQNLHQFFKNSISIYNVALRWKKPLGLTSPGNVKNYVIFRGQTNDFNAASTVAIGTSTRCIYIDVKPPFSGGPPLLPFYYWVAGVNDAGVGAPTASLQVNPV